MTPTSTVPPTTQAIETQKCGAPRAKFEVPSIGSTTHAAPPSPAGRAWLSSPMNPSAGKTSKQPLCDERLRLAVDFGQIVLRPLEADRERLVEEPPPRHRAGLARDRLRREQPHVHERRSAFGHWIASEMAVGAAREDDRIAVGADEFGGRRPSTASPMNVNGTPAAAAAASKADAESRRRRSEEFIVVAAGRGNLEQVGIGGDRRARGRATAAADRSGRAR